MLVVAGPTATAALANSPHFKKGREPSCLKAGSAIRKSVTCGAGLAVPASVPDDNNNNNNNTATLGRTDGPGAKPTEPGCLTTSSGSARTNGTSLRSVAPARKPDSGETTRRGGTIVPTLWDAARKRMA